MAHGSHHRTEKIKRPYHKSGKNAGDHVKKDSRKQNWKKRENDRRRARRKANRNPNF